MEAAGPADCARINNNIRRNPTLIGPNSASSTRQLAKVACIFRSGIAVFLIAFSYTYGQGQSAFAFLQISQSPAMNGMGQLGTALPSRDIYSTYYNPANFRSVHPGFTFSYNPTLRSDWIAGIDMYNHIGFIGYGTTGSTSQLGLTLCHNYFDYGTVEATIEWGENGLQMIDLHPFSSVRAIALGVHKQILHRVLPLWVSIGGTVKRVFQDLNGSDVYQDGELVFKNIRAESTLFDGGVLIDAPVRLAYPGFPLQMQVQPALGYSLLNYGSEVRFTGYDNSYPPPSIARLGYSLSIELTLSRIKLPLIGWQFGREVDDRLVVFSGTGSEARWDIALPLGDIDIIKHVIRGEPESGVNIHNGTAITFLGVYTRRQGEVEGSPGCFTHGMGIRVGPLLKTIPFLWDRPITRGLAHHLDLSYNISVFENYSPFHGIRFSNITLTIYHIDQLLAKLWSNRR